MAERVSPWRSKPTQEVVDLLQQVGTVQLFLVQRPGPTSFIVREEGCEVKRKIQIGSRITCSCSPVGANGTCKELCLHILFVMVKVLRVPVGNPLLWQLSLSDRELEEVLRCSMQPERPPQEAAKAKPAADKTLAGQVKRREIEEEDPCPICYEDLAGQDLDNLVWCRFGCGRNVHGKCMGVWMEHQVQSLGKELTCPLCRSDWGEFKWRPPPPKRKGRAERRDVHYGAHCGACKQAPLLGKRFRCLICVDFDLCEGCFSGGHHPQHPFVVKETPQSFGAPVERPTMMPMALPIARAAPSPVGGAAAAAAGSSSPQPGNAQRLGARARSSNTLLEAAANNGGAGAGGRGGAGGGEGEAAHGEPEERRGSGTGAAGGGAGGNGRDALAVGVLGQHQQQHAAQPRQGSGARQPVRGTTVVRAGGGGGRVAPEEHSPPPCLDARLAAQRRPLLAVEGLTVRPGGAATTTTGAAGQGPHVLSDMPQVRRAALGQPSRPMLIRRTGSTVTHDRPSGAGDGGMGGAGPSGELILGLAGVPLNSGGGGGGERSLQGEAPGPGPGSMAAALSRQQQQAASGVPPRHPPRPGGPLQGRPGVSARPYLQPPIGSAAWAHPSAPSGSVAATAPSPPQPPDLMLLGRVVPHGEGASPRPVGRSPPPPPQPQGTLTHGGGAGPHGGPLQQPPAGVRCRGPPPRYVPTTDHRPQPPGLHRTHSAGAAGPMGLAVTARAMAPHPLTPELLVPIPLPPMPPTPTLPGSLQGGGPYGAEPYGNEMYGGGVQQYDGNFLLAFTDHIPGPGARLRSAEERPEAGGWLTADDDDRRPGGGGGGDAWGGDDSDGECVYSVDGGGSDDMQDLTPGGPTSPALHLFSSRPNSVPSEGVSNR
ncbi:hypothetical protein PLESTB_001310400 [Pleodorina starrii]|uniref:Uncharacterized protein n=1 Tax=Pleodorina starrii TaxID=330485 RepID=A0A9W6BTA0_9CHLO|nr:hypothetical protein PLESTM_001021200 [Pleodorina starrii]GLC58031.1 hypothetical protein PLESTB_001310400 [Pleodorina starrii]GLC69578.1 hypothetical protein PLESTF_000850700 [Pleodorina starrii]